MKNSWVLWLLLFVHACGSATPTVRARNAWPILTLLISNSADR